MTSPNNNEGVVELMRRELRTKLNSETSRLAWPELQRHFARGVVVVVEKELDLIEVAATFAEDNKPQTASWIQLGQIRTATDADALQWQTDTASFWAVVVAPWVLVQRVTSQ